MLDNLSKLRWACRRGMLELDVLLGNFLNEAFPGLELKDQKLFEHLLNYPDSELYTWLMGQAAPLDENIAKITQLIRCHARSRI